VREGAIPARLVVNADDFGISERVNEGIAQAHQQGIVTATSIMAVGRAFEHAVRLSRELPALDVGVHLTLVAERPLRPAPSLVDADGRFPAAAGPLVRRLATGSVRLVEVEAEWAAQIERVLAAGIRPSHLDSHQHVHILPGLAGIVKYLAQQYHIARVRLPLEYPPLVWPRGMAAVLRLGGLAALWVTWFCARLGGAYGLALPPLHFLGFLDGGRLNEERLLRLLARIQPGRDYELMCHPGLAPEELELRAWGYSHEKELQALTSPRVRRVLDDRAIRLSRFSAL